MRWEAVEIRLNFLALDCIWRGYGQYRIHAYTDDVKMIRGSDGMQKTLFIIAKLDDSVPADHPLNVIRDICE